EQAPNSKNLPLKAYYIHPHRNFKQVSSAECTQALRDMGMLSSPPKTRQRASPLPFWGCRLQRYESFSVTADRRSSKRFLPSSDSRYARERISWMASDSLETCEAAPRGWPWARRR